MSTSLSANFDGAGSMMAPNSEFARRAAALDLAELAAGEMVGGPTLAQSAAVRAAERALQSTVPATMADFRWLALRLARAVENGWSREAARPLVAMTGFA